MPDLDSTYPKTPMNNLTDSLILLIHIYITNFELSPPAKRGQLRIFYSDFDFEDVQSNRFTSVRVDKSIISNAIDPALIQIWELIVGGER